MNLCRSAEQEAVDHPEEQAPPSEEQVRRADKADPDPTPPASRSVAQGKKVARRKEALPQGLEVVPPPRTREDQEEIAQLGNRAFSDKPLIQRSDPALRGPEIIQHLGWNLRASLVTEFEGGFL